MTRLRDDELGLHRDITRRDFVHLTGAGLAGAAFLGCGTDGAGGSEALSTSPSDPWSDALGPDWYGPGGLGDYASSHGNTPDVVRAAHRLRDARAPSLEDAIDTGDRFDVVIVGAGLAGLSAAHHFKRLNPSGRCLLLDNHPVFGGEAKRNELEVDGVRLMGPQGSNDFTVRPATGDHDDYFSALGIPREFEYAPQAGDIRAPLDNYGFMHWVQDRYSVGHFFREDQGGRWVRNLWDDVAQAPWSDAVRDGFRRWRTARVEEHRPADADAADEPPRWLDRITLKEYYEDVLGLPPEVTAYVDPILASIIGLGCDAVSAWWGYHFALPGFGAPSRYDGVTFHSFPGGNTGIARYFVKNLRPDSIEGTLELGDVIGGHTDFASLDREGEAVRIRLAATVIDVRHAGPRDASERVRVTYLYGGRAYTVEAAGVVMASGGWMNRYVLPDLPDSHQAAYETFHHAPILVANVALRNWQFLERLGIAACLYEGDLGFSCNIRRPMYAGSYRPPFGPNHPTLLTFYITFEAPGPSAAEQGARGRTELLSTRFAEYERRLRTQMFELFGDAGFDPAADIAGLVLNRWGHAYVAPGPGFFFGSGGEPAPAEVIREPFGRIAIGHSELRGHQNWTGATAEGRRAVEAVLDRV
jgi:spermidine dehydrogenase